MTRKRSVRSIAFGVGFSLALAAIAFFFTTYLADGEHEGETGKGSTEALNINIGFPDGVTPTNPVEVTAELENTSGEPLQFESFPMEIKTPTVPICGNNWLQLRGEGETSSGHIGWDKIIHGTNEQPMDPIPAGTTSIIEGGTVWLEFKPGLIEGTDQTSCEEVPVIVTGHLE